MKTAGWIFIVIGALAFFGAALKGNSVFGPLFWIGLGCTLIYLKKEKEENKKERNAIETSVPIQPKKPLVTGNDVMVDEVEQNSPMSFEQKEAALCLIAFFAGYNDDLATNDAAYMISYQSSSFFNIYDYQKVLTAALPKYQDADKLIDTVLTIKDRKTKEFILLTCYELSSMSRKSEANEFIYNIAKEMGYNRPEFRNMAEQHMKKQVLY